MGGKLPRKCEVAILSRLEEIGIYYLTSYLVCAVQKNSAQTVESSLTSTPKLLASVTWPTNEKRMTEIHSHRRPLRHCLLLRPIINVRSCSSCQAHYEFPILYSITPPRSVCLLDAPVLYDLSYRGRMGKISVTRPAGSSILIPPLSANRQDFGGGG